MFELPSCEGISQLKVIEVFVDDSLTRLSGSLGTAAARMPKEADSRESPTVLIATILNS